MKEELQFVCEDFKITAKQEIGVVEKLNNLEYDTSEYRIQYEVLTNILKKLNVYGELIYSVILSYNNDPDAFTSITKEDILRLQLVQDEVTFMLKESGITMQYNHPNDKNVAL